MANIPSDCRKCGDQQISLCMFEDIRKFLRGTDTNPLIIDVRNPEELTQTGKIPTSINIPLGLLDESLKLPELEFVNKFDHRKPALDAELIFSCKSGKRATMAWETALKFGYKNSKVYKGSWDDWSVENSKCPEK